MKRMNQFVCALLIGCVLLTGCGSNTNTTETKEEVISDSQANASTEATQSESTSEEKMIPLQDGLKVYMKHPLHSLL